MSKIANECLLHWFVWIDYLKGSSALDSNDYIAYNSSGGAGIGVEFALLGIKLGITAADFVVI